MVVSYFSMYIVKLDTRVNMLENDAYCLCLT